MSRSSELSARPGLTGIVLAGGEARRLGGIDKGWYEIGRRALIEHTLTALAGACDRFVISANRNHERYRALGHPVVSDRGSEYAGPLAGIAAGLSVVDTEWALVVPVDTPCLPDDLVTRLESAATPDIDLIHATSPRGRQPLHCLLRTQLRADLERTLAAGERRVMAWQDTLATREVVFDSDQPFLNLNRAEDGERLLALFSNSFPSR